MRFNLPIFIGTLVLFAALIASALLGYVIAQLIRGFLPIDLFTLSLAVFLLAATAILLYVLFELVKNQQSPVVREIPRGPIEKSLEEPFVRQRRRIYPSVMSPDWELQSRLIRMLSGDRARAERLVDQAKQMYPNRWEDWYWQSVIEELERDRR